MKASVAALIFIMWSGAVFAQSDCQSPLIYAGRDLDAVSVQEAFVSQAYNSMCSGKTTKSGLNINSSLSSLIKAVPVKAALSGGSDKEKAEQFCKEQSDFSDIHRAASRRSSIVVREALQAFNVCKAMELAQVRMNFDIGLRGFAIKVARGGDDANFEGVVVTPSDAAVCSMTKIEENEGKLVPVGPATFFPLTGREITITCEKNIQDGVIPGMEVQIKTSRKSERLDFLPDFEYRPQYASQMRELLETKDKEYHEVFDQQNQRLNNLGSYRTDKPKPIVMTGGAGWDKLEKCPAGYYVAGVGAHGGGGGRYCYNCVETVKFICEPFNPSTDQAQ